VNKVIDVAAGGIRTLVSIMKEHPDNEMVAAGVFLAFGDCATNSDAMADALALEGGLEAVFELVPRHVDIIHLEVFAIGAIGACVSLDDTVYVKDTILSIHNAACPIVQAMYKHAECEDFQVLAFVWYSRTWPLVSTCAVVSFAREVSLS